MATSAHAATVELGVRAYRRRRSVGHQGTDDLGSDRVAVTLFSEMSLEHLIVSTACQPQFTTLFKASAPDWNQSFHWRGVDPRTDGSGSRALQSLIQSSFAETSKVVAVHDATSPRPTGYRWTWLALIGVELKVDAAMTHVRRINDAATCRLAIDQWQAAYFLDFGNQPRSRLRRVLHRLMHWRFSLSHAGTT